MDPRRRRDGHGRHHRLCAAAAGRCRVRRAAGCRQGVGAGQGRRRGGIGQGGERGLCPGRRRGDRRPTRCCVDQPDTVNSDPQGDGWFFKLKLERPGAARRADGPGRLRRLHGGPWLMRYLPLTDDDRTGMLARIGAPSVDALFEDVPAVRATPGPIEGLPNHEGELGVERRMKALAAQQSCRPGSVPFFCGAGAYRHHVPAAVDHLIQRGEFLTSYTPYQPEVSQGTLQYLFEFQTQVALLTGMEVANASMYDGSTACAEAVMMANRVTRRGRARAVGWPASALRRGHRAPRRAGPTSPPSRRRPMSPATKIWRRDRRPDAPASWSRIPRCSAMCSDLTALADACHAKGALLVVVVTEVVSLGLLDPARRDGRRYRRGRGPVDRQCAEFRRALCRAVRHAREICAADAGPAVRRDGRRRGPARLGADACRPASSTSGARRRPAISAPIRGLCALAFTIHLSLLGEAGLRGWPSSTMPRP